MMEVHLAHAIAWDTWCLNRSAPPKLTSSPWVAARVPRPRRQPRLQQRPRRPPRSPHRHERHRHAGKELHRLALMSLYGE
jgi:hypothetical protein